MVDVILTILDMTIAAAMGFTSFGFWCLLVSTKLNEFIPDTMAIVLTLGFMALLVKVVTKFHSNLIKNSKRRIAIEETEKENRKEFKFIDAD